MNEEETKRKEYLEQRKSYVEDYSQQSDLLDKHLLTISTGSFGLSFIFVEKIVQETIQKPKILVYSWILFACSVICCLLSFICSKAAFKKAIEELDKQNNNAKHKFDTSFQDLRTSTFNIFSIIFLILGFGTFIVFAYFNVVRG